MEHSLAPAKAQRSNPVMTPGRPAVVGAMRRCVPFLINHHNAI
ncbi:hypothetical protein [Hymenobacter gummosus]|nr:hypothetical protein [Hymenobacter gummosus]